MTRLMLKAIVSFALFMAVAALAQTYQAPPAFKHIVIIVQENRTPDDLFQPTSTVACGSQNPFQAGVDIQNGGPNLASQQNGDPYITCMTPVDNLSNGGTSHKHAQWELQYDSGALDGACLATWPNCPEYDSVEQSVVQPYYDIAANYGWANYMFSTHEGPSYPSHQFLFGGTSAPVPPGDPNNFYLDFVAENANFNDSGCPSSSGAPDWINPGGFEIPPANDSECYDHNTLVTYQDSSGVVHDKTASLENGGWKYYAQTDGIIWDAPETNPQTCYFATSGSGACTSTEFTDHVVIEKNVELTSAPILKQIKNCELASISWVTPDEAWSDHPGSGDKSKGPSWVADIVDAIGNSWSNSGHQCDYWGTNSTTDPEPTAIFITWDDWGGFYDHVAPPAIYRGVQIVAGGPWVCDAPNSWGCGYVYGYRVPLLVVSEYTPPRTISGACGASPLPSCPNEGTNDIYVHDFGSILRFTELNFGLGPIAPSGYSYADLNSLDTNNGAYVPLWDFFLGSARSFTTISPTNSSYDGDFFMNYYTTLQDGSYPQPTGPDGGSDD